MKKASLALALAALAVTAVSAQAATPKAGSWDGDVSPRGEVHLVIKKHDGKAKITKAKIEGAKMTCTPVVDPGQAHTETISTKLYMLPIKIKHAKFSSQESGAASVELSGKFTSKRRASGTFSYDYFHGGEDCATGELNWSAKLG